MTERSEADRAASPQRIAEVVESASHSFTAQCYELHRSPPLGAFVRTRSLGPAPGPGTGDGSGRTYAVVYSVVTQALDPGRPVIARGENEDNEDNIYRSNPQLPRLLCTRFQALIVGHSDGALLKQYLPPLPPRIHAFVYCCTPDEVGQFARSLDYLSLLVHSTPLGQGITDEVVAAVIRHASEYLEDRRSLLVQAGKALAVQMAGDLPRLNSILRRISP